MALPTGVSKELALKVALAARIAKKDVKTYLDELKTVEFPRFSEESFLVDELVATNNSFFNVKLFPLQRAAGEEWAKIEADVLTHTNNPSFSADIDAYAEKHEKQSEEDFVNGPDYYMHIGTFFAAPFLFLSFINIYIHEFQHIEHAKHQQIDRILGHEGGDAHH